ncbi:MAG: hypothetical protein ABJG14_09730 [Sulfitobacter sp.]|uniref:hypothetical protein n=1 Tax=Alphaproteobacteria TaxID=28211 RepID=UPI003266F9A7
MIDGSDWSDEVAGTAKAAQEVDKAMGQPMALLLGPTFKLIGEHWGKKTEAYLNAKQAENIEDKIEGALEAGPILLGNKASPRQIAALVEWTDAARDVDRIENPELSKAWSQALRDISEQNYTLLDALAKLSEADIEILKAGGTLTQNQLKKFTNLGLIEEQRRGTRFERFLETFCGLFLMAVSSLFALGGLALLASALFGWPRIGELPMEEASITFFVLVSIVTLGGIVTTFSVIKDMGNMFFADACPARISFLGRQLISRLTNELEPKIFLLKSDLATQGAV